ncbi:MAG: helix-turn-helix domain-containing protein [Candidatus Thorarchaeota archaeon]
MSFIIKKDSEDIIESDLQYLIDNEIIEVKNLEYKRDLPGNSDSEKKELLADISSFANASGGDIIYGITQDNSTGKPVDPLEGFPISNADETKQRLDNIILNGLEPQLPSYSYSINPISLSNSNYAFLIRIFRSWFNPHRISFKNSQKFYSRNSSGKYLMDIQELRSAFILSESITQKIKNFVERRLASIVSNESHIQFNNKEIFVLHLVPLEAFSLGKTFEINNLAKKSYALMPLHSSNWNARFNIDGYLTFNVIKTRKPFEKSYVQLYRNGIIEVAEDYLFQHYKENGKISIIPISEIETELMQKLPQYLKNLKEIKVDPPIYLSINIFGVKGFGHPSHVHETYPIDRDHLNPASILIESYSANLGELMKPMFDSLWNACGISKSPNYDEGGNWVKP